jgi:hypothetical protein
MINGGATIKNLFSNKIGGALSAMRAPGALRQGEGQLVFSPSCVYFARRG